MPLVLLNHVPTKPSHNVTMQALNEGELRRQLQERREDVRHPSQG